MRGRGCVFVVCLALCTPVFASENDYATPSGQVVTLTEILLDDAPGAPWLRFRFLAPQIARDGGQIDATEAAQDMAFLCQEVAVPYAAAQGLVPDRIVMSLSDRDVAFGETNPDATQFFDLFRLQDDLCIWEEF